jgi:uncharacterized protein (DUF3820 family)
MLPSFAIAGNDPAAYFPPVTPIESRGRYRLQFGKHKGRTLAECPCDYLVWILDEPGISHTLKRIVARYLDLDQPEDDINPAPDLAAVVLPGVVWRWASEMEARCTTALELAIVVHGLRLLQRLCSEYTRRPWLENGGAA